LFCLAALPAAGAARADDLLPPPVRQAERRTLGANEERLRRTYFIDGRGGTGAAFSPDGKLLVTAGNQGMTLWDVGSGRALGQFSHEYNNEGLSAAFTPDGKQLVAA